MKTLCLPWFFQLIAVTLVYELRCPAPGHWRLRARNFYCGRSYVCLLRSPENTYHETCDGLDYSSTGSKLIFEPSFNKAGCSYKRYQPFPFSTEGNNKCVYQKSFCNEEGQIIILEGNMINDTTCGCDPLQGYIFVNKPEHNCYCIPSKEDCSCHKLSCNAKDATCPFIGNAARNTSCPEIITRPSTQQNLSSEDSFNDAGCYYEGRKYRLTCFYFSTALLIVMVIVLTVIGLSEWPDIFYEDRSSDINIHRKCLVDQLVSSNVLNEMEGDLIKNGSSNEEKNRTLIGILLCAEKDHYDNFLAILRSSTEYNGLADLIENTDVTDDDRIKFQNCYQTIAKSI